MPEKSYDAKALEAVLPHRGPNLLPDSVVLDLEKGIATSRVRVPRDDARGRMLFSRRDAAGTACWLEPFLGELMALTGVPLLHDRMAEKGQFAAFSMISRLAFHHPVAMDADVIGHAQITRDRGEFTVFSTFAECAGRKLLEAEVMSAAVRFGDVVSTPVRPFAKDPGGEAVAAGDFAWKEPHLRGVDRLVRVGEGRVLGSYVYPTDHPFVPGHFPGGALMMGMHQWTAVADTAWAARRRLGLAGDLLVNGTIKREDGSEILDVRDLVLRDEGGVPRIAATKRLAFRGVVRPGDGVLIDLAVVQAPPAT